MSTKKEKKMENKIKDSNPDTLFKTILHQEPKGLMAYAQEYARAGLGMKGKMLKVQIAYVLCNLGGWRGEEAREVKKRLKEAAAKI